jgi:hypothetical protein
MQRLMYISTTRRPLPATDLGAILAASRRNNAKVGVTGLLVAGGRRFLQVLEGPDYAVETLFRRIEEDRRHHAIVILSRMEIAAPSFRHWAMGYCCGGAADDDAPTLPETVAQLLAPIIDPTIRGYFEGFAAVHAAA